MKIAVYALAKNEARFAQRWAESCAEADWRGVTDTGSTDRTIEILEANGVTVHRARIEPWRFDVARNESLRQVPADIDVCICLDLDEVLVPGWRPIVERAWRAGTTALRYPFVTRFQPDGLTPLALISGFKVHRRDAYFWKYGVHEVLWPLVPSCEARVDVPLVHHRPDLAPEASREKLAGYLGLLEELKREEPAESRYLFFLGETKLALGDFEGAIRAFGEFLEFPTEPWPQERSAAWRYVAHCRKRLGQAPDVVVDCLLRGALESPRAREPWIDLASTLAELGNWPNSFAAAMNGLRVNDPAESLHIDPSCWSGRAEELFRESGRRLGVPAARVAELLESAGGEG